MIKVENTTQPPPTQFAAIERNFHETQAGQGLRKSHTPKKVGVRFGVRAISLNCVDLRGPNTQKHMYCVEFLRVASRFDSFSKSLPLRVGKRAYLNIQRMQTGLLTTDFLTFLSSTQSMNSYFNFIKEKGKPLSEINPGSDELALTVSDALQALDLLRDSQTVVLGGDVLSEKNEELIYAYQLWGDEHQYLNWYCDRIDNESKASYLQRSYELAREGITNANKTAEQLKKKCYIVFVTE